MIEFEGLEEVLKDFDILKNGEKYNAALKKACALVERSARQKAPKNSGELRRSIASKVENYEGIVYTPLEYAPYVEYGTGLFAEDGKGRSEVPWVYVEGSSRTSNKKTIYKNEAEAERAAAYLKEEKGLKAVVTYGQHPEPFLRPALDENREEILRIFSEAVNND